MVYPTDGGAFWGTTVFSGEIWAISYRESACASLVPRGVSRGDPTGHAANQLGSSSWRVGHM